MKNNFIVKKIIFILIFSTFLFMETLAFSQTQDFVGEWIVTSYTVNGIRSKEFIDTKVRIVKENNDTYSFNWDEGVDFSGFFKKAVFVVKGGLIYKKRIQAS